jgi:quercetin dioxygenase-like cupin family protein
LDAVREPIGLQRREPQPGEKDCARRASLPRYGRDVCPSRASVATNGVSLPSSGLAGRLAERLYSSSIEPLVPDKFPEPTASLSCGFSVMKHPTVIKPSEHAAWHPDKMGKSTIFESPRLLVGLNAFEPGQSHALHAHPGMDKLYFVLDGEGLFLLDGAELPMRAGELLVAPDGVPHGVRNSGQGRLLVLAVLAS